MIGILSKILQPLKLETYTSYFTAGCEKHNVTVTQINESNFPPARCNVFSSGLFYADLPSYFTSQTLKFIENMEQNGMTQECEIEYSSVTATTKAYPKNFHESYAQRTGYQDQSPKNMEQPQEKYISMTEVEPISGSIGYSPTQYVHIVPTYQPTMGWGPPLYDKTRYYPQRVQGQVGRVPGEKSRARRQHEWLDESPQLQQSYEYQTNLHMQQQEYIDTNTCTSLPSQAHQPSYIPNSPDPQDDTFPRAYHSDVGPNQYDYTTSSSQSSSFIGHQSSPLTVPRAIDTTLPHPTPTSASSQFSSLTSSLSQSKTEHEHKRAPRYILPSSNPNHYSYPNRYAVRTITICNTNRKFIAYKGPYDPPQEQATPAGISYVSDLSNPNSGSTIPSSPPPSHETHPPSCPTLSLSPSPPLLLKQPTFIETSKQSTCQEHPMFQSGLYNPFYKPYIPQHQDKSFPSPYSDIDRLEYNLLCRRARHNVSERKRITSLKHSLGKLVTVLPGMAIMNVHRSVTGMERILQQAIQRIQNLKVQSRCKQEELGELRILNGSLRLTIAHLEETKAG